MFPYNWRYINAEASDTLLYDVKVQFFLSDKYYFLVAFEEIH